MKGKWLSSCDVAASYNQVAYFYDNSWLTQLQSITDRFLSLLPPPPSSLPIIDLGCGTGYTTQHLLSLFPDHKINAIDLSEKMLCRAKEKNKSEQIEFIQMDMLEYLQRQTKSSASMIVSGWAIGYSNPEKIIHEAQRVLSSNGLLTFVLNYRDTLQPIFLAFRKCMARFSNSLKKVTIPKFPKDFNTIDNILRRNGFEAVSHEDGYQPIQKPLTEKSYLQWVLKTGVLAGFESMLPLKEKGPVADYFENLLKTNDNPIEHHYLIVIARLK